jgi:ADP-ribose pyrophosphatase YjhB (NUDIX family)
MVCYKQLPPTTQRTPTPDGMDLLLFEYPRAGFQLPAGTVEANEPHAEAAAREAREETGLLDLPPGRFLSAVQETLSDDHFLITSTIRVYSRPDLTASTGLPSATVSWCECTTSGQRSRSHVRRARSAHRTGRGQLPNHRVSTNGCAHPPGDALFLSLPLPWADAGNLVGRYRQSSLSALLGTTRPAAANRHAAALVGRYPEAVPCHHAGVKTRKLGEALCRRRMCLNSLPHAKNMAFKSESMEYGASTRFSNRGNRASIKAYYSIPPRIPSQPRQRHCEASQPASAVYRQHRAYTTYRRL